MCRLCDRLMGLLVAVLLLTSSARIHAGGPNLDSSDVIFAVRGDHDSARFGRGYLAFLGDVNGDGYDDLAVRRYNPDGFNIYFGSQYPDTIPDMFLRGHYGPPVAVDMDGDGIDDVIVTERIPTSPPGAWVGQLLIYKGFGDSLSSVPIDSIRIPSEEYQFCARFEVGDIDGDSYPDFLLTSHLLNRFFLYRGPLNLADNPVWTFDIADAGYAQTVRWNSSSGQNLGFTDWNGDGHQDIYLGATADVDSIGYVWIFLGPDFRESPDVVIQAPVDAYPFISQRNFARVVSNIGDVNSDGYEDIGVAFDVLGLVYFGGPSADTLPDVEMVSHAHCMLNIGDFNGDGYSDLLMGRGQFYSGSADFHMGGPRFDGIIDDYIAYLDLPPWFLSEIGLYAAGQGDFNGDGFPDVAIGCDNFYQRRGAVFVIAGSPNVVVPVNEPPQIEVPIGVELFQNYPNPFNPSTTISFSLPEKSYVTLTIHNVLGQRVKTLLSHELSAGTHSVVWDGTDAHGDDVASGVYVYRLMADEVVLSRKMVLAR
jgi:hypothetical protein